MMKNTPGPLAPPVRRRPSLKITARSYSWTTWRGAEVTDLLRGQTDLDGEQEGEGQRAEDHQEAGHGDQERAHTRTLVTGNWNIHSSHKLNSDHWDNFWIQPLITGLSFIMASLLHWIMSRIKSLSHASCMTKAIKLNVSLEWSCGSTPSYCPDSWRLTIRT